MIQKREPEPLFLELLFSACRHWPVTVGIVSGILIWATLSAKSPGFGARLGAVLGLLCAGFGVWVELSAGQKTEAAPLGGKQEEHGAVKKTVRRPEEIWKEIDSLIGLAPVKEFLREIAALISADRERQRQGLPPLKQSLHMAFLGNPGTGKTTVARLVGELFAAMGVLPSGHFVETDRSGLVAGYIGQTSLKVQEKVRQAMGGVLFVDEAYSLARGGDTDFGREALDTLIKAMEDHRDKLCVILAGYTGNMQELFKLNPGLESRVAFTVEFPDYSPAELVKIAEMYAEKRGWILGPGVVEKLQQFFEREQHRIGELGNGRFARNVIEQAERKAAVRIARGDKKADLLVEEDFSEIFYKRKRS